MAELDMINARFDEIVRLLGRNAKPQYTYFEWFYLWYDTILSQKPINQKTKNEYKRNFEVYIMPNMEDIALAKMTSLTVVDCLNRIPPSRTKEGVYCVFSASIRSAFNDGLIDHNFMQSVVPYKHERQKGRCLTQAEQAELIGYCERKKGVVYLAILFTLFTGTRRGEVVGMEQTDLDFEKERIHIRGTKTKRSNRIIPMFADTKRVLLSVPTDQKRLFPMRADYFGKAVANLPLSFRLNVKDLRTTCANNLKKRGFTESFINSYLGHTSLTTTQNSYLIDKIGNMECELRKLNIE